VVLLQSVLDVSEAHFSHRLLQLHWRL
jgi:hypothetical protein